MCTSLRSHSRKGGSSSRMVKLRAFFERQDTFEELADHVLSKERVATEELYMRVERTVTVSQATGKDAIVDSSGFLDDAVN